MLKYNLPHYLRCSLLQVLGMTMNYHDARQVQHGILYPYIPIQGIPEVVNVDSADSQVRSFTNSKHNGSAEGRICL